MGPASCRELFAPVSYTHLDVYKRQIWGTVIGALIIQSLNTGLVLLGMNDFVQMVVKGAIIIIAVILDERKNR